MYAACAVTRFDSVIWRNSVEKSLQSPVAPLGPVRYSPCGPVPTTSSR